MRDEIDDERLAALLEGRLQSEERDALLAHLAADEGEDFYVFANTARVLREMEEEAAEERAALGWTRHCGRVMTRVAARLWFWRH